MLFIVFFMQSPLPEPPGSPTTPRCCTQRTVSTLFCFVSVRI